MTEILFRRAPDCLDLPVPQYQTDGAAGMDLHAAETIVLWRGEIKLIRTGLFMELPCGFEAQVRPRSGMALRGVTVANAPGTIDSDYRGEIMVMLTMIGNGASNVPIRRGDRIAQMVVAPVTRLPMREVTELGETRRGADGFGSTGR